MHRRNVENDNIDKIRKLKTEVEKIVEKDNTVTRKYHLKFFIDDLEKKINIGVGKEMLI